ncbi:MAG: lysylphosphatidylglycerol synthase domain-containing protein [Dehalococcoidia bacterium]|nr:lysylphosphatidylglycerol synthase domain-containing protein [Dehalococcoidia bacterium]
MLPGPFKRALRWGIICLVIAFWGLYIWRNWDSLLSHQWEVNFYWLALSFLVVLVFWLSLPIIWHRALIAAGGSLRLRVAARLWALSMLARYLPGGMWHIAGRVYMAEEAGESRTIVFVSTVIEQVLSLMTTMLIFLVSVPFWDADYARFAPVLLLVIPLAFSIHPVVLSRLGTLAIRLAGRKQGGNKAGVLPGEPFVPPGYRAILFIAALYVLPNILAALSLYLAAAAVGPVSPDQLPAFAGAYTIGWIAGFFAFFAPSGLGVREGAITLLLTPVVGAPVALAASILNRVVFSLGEAVFVAACWALTRGDVKGKRGPSAEGGEDGRSPVTSP